MRWSGLNTRWLLNGLSLLNLGLLCACCSGFLISLLLLGDFMAHHATGHSTCHRVMPRHVSCYTADYRTFDTTFGKCRTLKQERNHQHQRDYFLHFQPEWKFIIAASLGLFLPFCRTAPIRVMIPIQPTLHYYRIDHDE